MVLVGRRPPGGDVRYSAQNTEDARSAQHCRLSPTQPPGCLPFTTQMRGAPLYSQTTYSLSNPTMFIKSFAPSLVLFLFLCFCGCGEKGPNVQFVEGIVTFESKPLSNVLVVFHPKSNDAVAASGFTDDKGVFRLTALQGGANNAGAPLGEYAVTFARDKDEPTSYKEVKEAAGTERVPVFDSLIPMRYNDPKTSGVSVTVEKKKNRFEFTLESK